MNDGKILLEARDVEIAYKIGDFRDIGLKEWFTRKLTHNYRVEKFKAVDGVSFTLERGELLGIVGTNGAGKSTLLKAASGIMEPSAGSFVRRGSISALLELGCIPIVNENDSVSSAEIETGKSKVLGDNDTLPAIVAGLCRADLLVLLSDIDGLYDSDPRQNPDARLIHHVGTITPEIEALAGGRGSKWGTGGMVTKITAARRAMAHGIDMVIANGARMEDLYGIVAGEDIGTRFSPQGQA